MGNLSQLPSAQSAMRGFVISNFILHFWAMRMVIFYLRKKPTFWGYANAVNPIKNTNMYLFGYFMVLTFNLSHLQHISTITL